MTKRPNSPYSLEHGIEVRFHLRQRARVSLELLAGAREAHGREVVEVHQHFVRLLKTLKTEKITQREDEVCC